MSAARKRSTAGIAARRIAAALPLALTAVLGAIHLPHPFDGDQALFLYGASELSRGRVLYVDFLDVKQPGIFLVYLAAGRLFGFSEIGVHAFELLYLLAFGVLAAVVLRRHLTNSWLAVFAPWTTVGAYYAVTETWHLTQLEILVAFPLLVCVALADPGRRTPRARAIAFAGSGIAAGVLAVFKLVLALIPVAVWVVAAWLAIRKHRWSARDLVLTALIPAAAGVLLVLGACVVWYWRLGALHELWIMSFVYPLEAVATVEGGGRLDAAMSWFVKGFAPWLGLASCAGLAWRGAARERLFLQLAAWGVAGFGAILIQRNSHWAYHMLLLVAPTGLLALRGIDGILVTMTERRLIGPSFRVWAVIVAILAASLPGLVRWNAKAAAWTRLGATLDPDRVRSYQRSVSARYARFSRDVEWLARPGAEPGAIYVFGNPLYYHLSGRREAIPPSGWIWDLAPPSLWIPLGDQLAAGCPAYVRMDSTWQALIAAKAPRADRWLRAAYAPVPGRAGWYQPRPGACVPSSNEASASAELVR